MKKKTTDRGFTYFEGIDTYDYKYSIQESSSTEEPKIWLGIDDPNPIIMASDALKLGVDTNETTGWVKFPIPKEVSINTRMHLNQEQAADLIELLKVFVETGGLD